MLQADSNDSHMLTNINTVYTPEFRSRIESKDLGVFFENMDEEDCPAGTVLFTPGESVERLYILKQGRIDLYRVTRNGKRLVTRQILPGSIFGIMGLLGQTTQGDYAETVEDSIVCSITRYDILKILKQHPEISLHLLEEVGTRLLLIEERLVEATYSPVRVRLAHFVLMNVDTATGILTNFTHEEIGDIIGAARQTVTETLNLLQHQGFILIGPKKIRIINRPGLEEIVNST
jgi:CRP/FNR family transcriptional regulator, cyclic AMP receptor protein